MLTYEVTNRPGYTSFAFAVKISHGGFWSVGVMMADGKYMTITYWHHSLYVAKTRCIQCLSRVRKLKKYGQHNSWWHYCIMYVKKHINFVRTFSVSGLGKFVINWRIVTRAAENPIFWRIVTRPGTFWSIVTRSGTFWRIVTRTRLALIDVCGERFFNVEDQRFKE